MFTSGLTSQSHLITCCIYCNTIYKKFLEASDNMASNELTFNVTGRYMNGSQVVGYQLVGQDGNQLQVNSDRIIFMIGRNQIANMRIQYSDGQVVPRGKGVNLNKLPRFDVTKQQFGGNEASQKAAKIQNRANYNVMGQLEIVKRIMRGKTVEGYVVRDFSGAEKKLPRSKVIELASNKIISNATVSKYNPYKNMTLEQARQTPRFKQSEWDYVQKWGYITRLNGVGVQLDTLPAMVILADGQIVDPKDKTNYNKMTVRAICIGRGGTLYDTVQKKHKTFKVGDYIVVLPDGTLTCADRTEFMKKLKPIQSVKQATCDEFLKNLVNYDVELFGMNRSKIQESAVRSWAVFKYV